MSDIDVLRSRIRDLEALLEGARAERDRAQRIAEQADREAAMWQRRYQMEADTGRASSMRLAIGRLRDAREVALPAGFDLKPEAKAKMYDIQQDMIRAAIAADDRALAALATTTAAAPSDTVAEAWAISRAVGTPAAPPSSPASAVGALDVLAVACPLPSCCRDAGKPLNPRAATECPTCGGERLLYGVRGPGWTDCPGCTPVESSKRER